MIPGTGHTIPVITAIVPIIPGRARGTMTTGTGGTATIPPGIMPPGMIPGITAAGMIPGPGAAGSTIPGIPPIITAAGMVPGITTIITMAAITAEATGIIGALIPGAPAMTWPAATVRRRWAASPRRPGGWDAPPRPPQPRRPVAAAAPPPSVPPRLPAAA